jgi:hypothetical protein
MQIPESTRQAIDWLRKYRSEDDLRKFLHGRSEEQLKAIEQYIARKQQL